MRIGFGFDVHRLQPDRELVLGGVLIPYERGLLGHSDADVLLHAICDALLGAAGQGDIGKHFPDTDMQYKNISSLILLQEVGRLIKAGGFEIHNVDSTIVAQEPRLSGYISEMCTNIAQSLDIECSKVNVKATTTEKLGFEGRGEGISAYAVTLLE